MKNRILFLALIIFTVINLFFIVIYFDLFPNLIGVFKKSSKIISISPSIIPPPRFTQKQILTPTLLVDFAGVKTINGKYELSGTIIKTNLANQQITVGSLDKKFSMEVKMATGAAVYQQLKKSNGQLSTQSASLNDLIVQKTKVIIPCEGGVQFTDPRRPDLATVDPCTTAKTIIILAPSNL